MGNKSIYTSGKTSRAVRGRTIPAQRQLQRGAALLVALVMIFMMTALGLTAMRESSLEKRMTTNSVHKSSTFQAAESSTDLVINNPDNLSAAFTNPGQVTTVSLPTPTNPEVTITGTIEYTGQGPSEGYSWGKKGGFQALRYIVEGKSQINAVQSESTVRQGTYRIVPALQ